MRKVTHNDLCEACNSYSENMGHALRDCPVACRVWEGSRVLCA